MPVVLRERIVQKLDEVPEADLADVMEYLEFLAWKSRQSQAGPVNEHPSKSGASSAADDLDALLDALAGSLGRESTADYDFGLKVASCLGMLCT